MGWRCLYSEQDCGFVRLRDWAVIITILILQKLNMDELWLRQLGARLNRCIGHWALGTVHYSIVDR